MKKIIAHFLILFLILNMVCCGNNIETENSNTENANNNTANDNSAANNVSVNQKVYSSIQYIVHDKCLPYDETKTIEYNNAIDAYNAFLVKEANNRLEQVNAGREVSFLNTSLKDLDYNGIPEIIIRMEMFFPYQIFTYYNGEVLEIPGPFSNGQHGNCGLLANGMYRSEHHSTGWTDTFVTYNKNGTQTIENFSAYDIYKYEKYTVKPGDNYLDTTKAIDYYSIEFKNDDDGKQKFKLLYEPYDKALNHYEYPEVWYSPFIRDMTLKYADDIMN